MGAMTSIAAEQWNGGIESAQAIYKFIGQEFQPIWAYQTLIDGQPQYDPLYGGPLLCIQGTDGKHWMSPGEGQ